MILNRLKILSEVEAAYIAGSIDGDGCIYIIPQRNSSDSFRVGVKVTCKEKDIVEWLYIHTGVGHIRSQKAYSSHQNNSVYWRWEVTSHGDVMDMLARIYQYTVTKKRRCELAYHLCTNMKKHGGGKLTDEQRVWRRAIYDEFKTLQSHQPIKKEGEFGENPNGTIPSQAEQHNDVGAEGVEVRPEITATSALPDREDMTRAME